MGEIVFAAHSGLRYLVLLAALFALIAAGLDLRGPAPGRAATVATKIFERVLDLQILLGILVLLTRPFVARNIGHIALMILAAGALHGFSKAASKRPAGNAAGFRLAGIALALLLIVAGILAIRSSLFASTAM